jgi:outer membrane lipoprotein-sorting protein
MPPMLLWIAAALAEEPSAEALAAWRELSAPATLQAEFVQVRHSRLLSQPIESTGSLAFEKPDRMAWSVRTPARSTFVMDGTQVGMAFPDLGVRESIDLSSSPDVASLVAGMMVWLGSDLERVQQDYTLTWETDHAVLVPKDDKLAAIIGSLDLRLTGSPKRIDRVTIVEPDGDTVTITFSEVKADQALPAGTFDLPE